MPEAEALEQEIEQNFNAFLSVVDDLVRDRHEGQFALMRKQTIVEFFNSAGEAVERGNSRYPDRLFSVQEVRSTPFDLGYFSHGGPYSDL